MCFHQKFANQKSLRMSLAWLQFEFSHRSVWYLLNVMYWVWVLGHNDWGTTNVHQDDDHHMFYQSTKELFGIVTRKYYKCTENIFSWNYIVRKSFLSNRRHWQPDGGNFHHDGSNVWCTVCLVLAEPWVPVMLSSMRRCSIAGRLSFGPPKQGEWHLCKLFSASLMTVSRSWA
jgi:hypothetical protein